MLDIFASFATDESAELNGTWMEFSGARILIARLGNAAYGKAASAAYELHKEALDKKDAAAEVLDRQIMNRVFAETILLGWENFSFKGQPLVYSVESAEMLLSIRDFRTAVPTLAASVENFRVKQEAEEVKN